MNQANALPNLFDALPPHIEAALRASIERFGVLVPVYFDQHGGVLDGNHRKTIADELGVRYDRIIRHCADDEERRAIAHTLNADRRQLDTDQLRESILHLAEWRDARGVGLSENAIGEALHVTGQAVSKHLTSNQLEVDRPERVRGLDGRVQPARRPSVFARDDHEQARGQAALEMIGDTAAPPMLGVAEAARTAARLRVPDPVTAVVAPPPGTYRCVVIDPPWPMQKIERDERPDQGQQLDYPTLPIYCQAPGYPYVNDWGTETTACSEQYDPHDDPETWADYEPCQSIECIVRHTLVRSALDDCHLYLWVTHKFLPDGLRLLDAWGFRYQCVMTWRKNVGITPFSWMYDTEHVLFARRGSLDLTRLGLRLSFDAPVTKHSTKPDVFYERVAEATPGPRLDMFARTPRGGFDVWGNEVSADAGA